MSSRWYYQMLMEEFGPVTTEQLRVLFEVGTLSEEDLVRSETGGDWTTFAAVKPSLFADSSDRPVAAMEEIGELSELAFEFEDAGPTMRRETYSKESVSQESAEDPTLISIASVPSTQMQRPTLAAADFGSRVTSPRVPAPQMDHSDEPAEEWFCESLGHVMGPMSLDELIELGESGALDASDRVRCGVRGIWKTVDCLPRLMKAVAAGRAIEVAPAAPSVTIQQPFAAAETATPADATSVPVDSMAKQPGADVQEFSFTTEPPHPAAPAAAGQPPEPEPVSTKSSSRNPRPKRRKKAKGEGELLDEIFDDVFNDDSTHARSNTVAQSATASSATASAVTTVSPPGQQTLPAMTPENPMSAASSASASQVSSRAAGTGLAAAAMAASRPSSNSSRSSFKINPKAIGILVAVMAVAAGGWYVSQSGIPGFSGSFGGNGTFDHGEAIKTLQAAMNQYKAVANNPSEAEWKEFSGKANAELSVLFKNLYDKASATPSGTAFLAATMCLIKIARSNPDNKEFIDNNLAEYERQIALVTK